MNRAMKMGFCLLSVLVLSACGQNEASTPSQTPESYTLGEGTLLSLDTLLPLGDDYKFEEISDAKEDTVSYVYTQLSNGSQVAQAYARALVKDWECDLQAEGSVDFSHESGLAKLIQDMEGTGRQLYITIQWDETSCTVTLSLTKTGTGTETETGTETNTGTESGTASESPTPSGPITLGEAVSYMESLSPSFLGLPGDSMDQYIVLCQEGTVYLNQAPCLLLNAYQKEDHKFESSYLLTVPGLQVYQLDRETGEATALS